MSNVISQESTKAINSKVEITETRVVNFAQFDKSAARLERVGGVDGNAYIAFGKSVFELLADKVTMATIYNRGIEIGLHEFADMKALYKASSAYEFSKFASDVLECKTDGVKRSHYRTFITLKAKHKKAKLARAESITILTECIKDSRNMSFVAHAQKYLPKVVKAESEETESQENPDAVETPSTMEEIITAIRTLTSKAIALDAVNGLNNVLDAVASFDNSAAQDTDAVENAISDAVAAVA